MKHVAIFLSEDREIEIVMRIDPFFVDDLMSKVGGGENFLSSFFSFYFGRNFNSCAGDKSSLADCV